MGTSTPYPDESHIVVFPQSPSAAESLPAQAPAAVSIPTSGQDKSGVGRLIQFAGCQLAGDEQDWMGVPFDLKVFDDAIS